MKTQWKRLTLALLLSGCSFAVTFFWYSYERAKLDKNMISAGTETIAQVSKVSNDVLKNQSNNLMWIDVNTGDQLYDGDSIQTTNRGEVRVQFEDGKFIDIEPDSLIKLERSSGEITLNLVEGSLFVNAKNTEGATGSGSGKSTGLVLSSNGGKVDLTGSNTSLAKGKGKSELNVQVLEGQAKVRGQDGQVQEINSGSNGKITGDRLTQEQYNLTIISPKTQKPNFVDPEKGNYSFFEWKGYPAEWEVEIHAGPTRQTLSFLQTEKLGPQKLKAPVSLGTSYWKLVAKDPVTKQIKSESPVYKTEYLARYAPTMIFPLADSKIPMATFPMDFAFKWQKGDQNNRIVLEVAEDALLQKKIVSKTFTKEDNFVLPNLKEGTYFWRMSAFYEDSTPMVGKIQKFTLEKIAKTQPKNPVQVVWNISPQGEQQFYIKDPQLDLSWKAANRQEDVTNWKLKIQDENSFPEITGQWDLKTSQMKAPLAKPGRYIASVEAYDKDGQLIGSSEKKSFSVVEKPLLQSPEFTKSAKGTLSAQSDGSADLQWSTVPGAQEYVLTIQNMSENKNREFKLKKTAAQFKSQTLNPKNSYQVKVEAVDQFGRRSKESQFVKLDVPTESNIQAPKLKGIKIKTDE